MKAVITSLTGGLYAADGENGEKLFCRARGSFRHDSISPSVGDKAEISDNERGENAIEKIYDRKNLLIRPPLANLDILFITAAIESPELSTLLIDKMTTIAEHNGIIPCIVITKKDLNPEKSHEVCGIYEKIGYPAFCISSKTGEGTEELYSFVKENCSGRISAFAGVSGAGKSTLINTLFPKLNCKTGEISQRIRRGKNTTRQTSLFRLCDISDIPEGYLADTPGFSLIDFERFNFYSLENLQYLYPEFDGYLTKCRYTKCTHTKEEGCAILDALNNGEISPSRHESYKILFDELKKKGYEK